MSKYLRKRTMYHMGRRLFGEVGEEGNDMKRKMKAWIGS